MVLACICVEQQRRRLTDVENNDVDVPVVGDVAESRAPSGFQRHVGNPSRLRHFFESSVAQIAM